MMAPDARCHECGYALRFHRNATGTRTEPLPGDPVVCGHCGSIGYLAEDGLTQIPSDADIRHWQATDPEKWRMVRNLQFQITNGST